MVKWWYYQPPAGLTLLIRTKRAGKALPRSHDKDFRSLYMQRAGGVAELLAQKDQKRCWRMMLMTMLISQPALAERVILALSTTVAVLKSCQQQLTQPQTMHQRGMPAVLVSTPWLSKEKNL